MYIALDKCSHELQHQAFQSLFNFLMCMCSTSKKSTVYATARLSVTHWCRGSHNDLIQTTVDLPSFQGGGTATSHKQMLWINDQFLSKWPMKQTLLSWKFWVRWYCSISKYLLPFSTGYWVEGRTATSKQTEGTHSRTWNAPPQSNQLEQDNELTSTIQWASSYCGHLTQNFSICYMFIHWI